MSLLLREGDNLFTQQNDAQLVRLRAACAKVIVTIEQRHKYRGDTTGKRKWELELVKVCKEALK